MKSILIFLIFVISAVVAYFILDFIYNMLVILKLIYTEWVAKRKRN